MFASTKWLGPVAILFPLAAVAQEIGDNRVCDRLVNLNRSGVYVAYPQVGSEDLLLPVRGKAPMPYTPDARLFFVPGFGPRLTHPGEEGVWHVRTRTRSVRPQGTDTALVFRARTQTRCSGENFLEAFDEDTKFVALRSYENYHAPVPDRNLSTALHDRFHFKIEDKLSKAADGCTWTDDRTAFPHFSTIYSFQTHVSNRVAEDLSLAPEAKASTRMSKYDGLSSEFAYDGRRSGRPACFGFTIPLPTNGLTRSWGGSKMTTARQAAFAWNPVSSEVLVKRLRGQVVRTVKFVTIYWNK